MSWTEELPELPGIYKITNKINGRIYIGQSKNIKARMGGHKYGEQVVDMAIRKYGWHAFKKEAIEVFPLNTPENVILYREMFWIKFLKSHVRYGGYNLRENIIDDRREEHQKKRREEKLRRIARQGNDLEKPIKERHEDIAEEDSANRKPVKQIDMTTGEVIRIWPSIIMAAQAIAGSKTGAPGIIRVIKGRYGSKSSYGYFWEYDDSVKESNKMPERTRRKIKEAIKGKRAGEHNGMFGKKHSEETKRKIKEKNISKRVAQVDKDTGEVIKIWDSIADAGRAFSKTGNKSPITNCANGARPGCKTAFGYKWKYIE